MKPISYNYLEKYGDKLNLEWLSDALKEYFGDRLKSDGSIDWWATRKDNKEDKTNDKDV